MSKALTRWGQIKCSLGFHDWGVWRDIKIEFVNKLSGKIAYEITAQARNCQRCNLEEQRK